MLNKQIQSYFDSLEIEKSADIKTLHKLILSISPNCKIWFLDGKNEEGKVVANPNIGYGEYTIHYADNTTRDFYKVGLSANTKGISIYLMGIEDYLEEIAVDKLGKAKVTSYCVQFKKLSDINLEFLLSIIQHCLLEKIKK